ncbi:MAG TPA: PVC-type heme-binding CxxCH protein [Planctomycetota bacterium]|nr:PVC-type heme-binding CxxCH protein [Planctomycetota bacterium]
MSTRLLAFLNLILSLGCVAGEITLDFETGDLRGWTATGTAFKNQPVEGDNSALRQKPSRLQGKFWIGTYENSKAGPGGTQGDEPTGTLTSAPIKIEKPWVSFLVGGGSKSTETYVALKLAKDGTEILRAAGEEQEAMRRVALDVKKYSGQDIIIEIVDKASGGWGHINFDDFRQHDAKPADSQPPVAAGPDVRLAAGKTAEEAVKLMQVPDGFTAKLVASEPDVHQPVGFCFDERGRLWLLECYEYPRGQPVGQKGKDRIRILQDTDGDGRAETIKTFYEGLNLATGLEVGYGGVFVGAAPHLLFIPDRNRDDVPDGDPEVLLSGFGRQDTHELLNSFIWGPDGWLYGCHGVFTHSVVQDTKFSAAIWRYHPVAKKFEIFAEGGSNQWGLDFDDHGSAFFTACVIPHLYHVIPGGLYIRQAGQNANPYAYGALDTIADHRHFVGANPHGGNNRSDSAGGGHAHCGAMIYLGDTFPAEYRNTLLMGNVHGNRVNRDIPKRAGSGYIGTHGPDFLVSNDKWFRVTAVKQGPDGSVYVSDWYDKQNCHHMNSDAWDRTNGRVYKVEYKGTAFPGAFDLAKLSTEELVKLQSDRNDWKVRHARRILAERKATEAAPALRELALNGANQELALRGLWALFSIGEFDESIAEQTLSSKHPWVRTWTVRFLGERGSVSDKLLSRLQQLAETDTAAEVRLQIASSCQRLSNDTLSLLHALMKRSEDAGDQNIPLLIWLACERSILKESARVAEFLAANCELPLVGNYILPRAARRLAATDDAKMLDACVALLAKAETVDAKNSVLLGLSQGLKGQGRRAAPVGWTEAVAGLKEKLGPGGRATLLALATQFGEQGAVKDAQSKAADASAASAERLEAVRTLSSARDNSSVPVLFGIIDSKSDEALCREAIRALAAHDVASIPQEMIKRWSSLPGLRVDCLDLLCGRKEWARVLLNAVADNTVARTDINENAVRRIRELNDPELSKLIEKSWGRLRERTPADVQAQIDKMRKVVQAGKGDPAAGSTIFEKTCMQCHTLFGKGAQVGPELTGSGRKDINYLLQNIIDPNAMIGAAYYTWTVKMKDGRVLTGLIAEQDERTVTLKRENNARDVLQRSEIAVMKEQPISLMPEGMHESLQPQEFRDLISFLQGDGWPTK